MVACPGRNRLNGGATVAAQVSSVWVATTATRQRGGRLRAGMRATLRSDKWWLGLVNVGTTTTH